MLPAAALAFPSVSGELPDCCRVALGNAEFQKAIKEAARKRAYRIIIDPARDEALAPLRAEMARETGVLVRGEA